jgi:SsrA-binding protein
MSPPTRYICQNRKAHFDYHIEETIEAGIVLTGSEVKSLRQGHASLQDAFMIESSGEVFLHRLHIPLYDKANRFNHDPLRPRKLLLHRKQINKLIGKIKIKGMTVIGLNLYFSTRNRVKVELALVKGKKAHDKRASEKDKDWKREQGRLLRKELD